MNTIPRSMYGWNTLPWTRIQRQVCKLQKRIYRATRRHDGSTVRKLQRLLLHSWSARLLAVRQVTQDNRGKRTAGVDGVKSFTPPQRLALAQSLTVLCQEGWPLRQQDWPFGLPEPQGGQRQVCQEEETAWDDRSI